MSSHSIPAPKSSSVASKKPAAHKPGSSKSKSVHKPAAKKDQKSAPGSPGAAKQHALPPTFKKSTAFQKAGAHYHGLAPLTKENAAQAAAVPHADKPYWVARRLVIGPSSLSGGEEGATGWGVFAGEDFVKGDIVEVCPLIVDKLEVLSNLEYKHADYAVNYAPAWEVSDTPMTQAQFKKAKPGTYVTKKTSSDNGVGGSKPSAQQDAEVHYPVVKVTANKDPRGALMLGYGGVYNHAESNNCEWLFGADRTMLIIASREITAGEELFVSYGADYWKQRGVEPL